MYDKVMKSKEYIENIIKEKCDTAIILGSGLGEFAEEFINKQYIDYKDIPNFPISTVEGHKGRFVFGELEGKKILAMQGRFHYYEGYEMKEVVYPVYVMKQLGIKKLFITNAAGGINKNFEKGILMIIRDHINLFGTNPLIGKNDDRFGARFPDMSEPYKKYLVEIALKAAKAKEIEIKEGVYAGVTGPYYETAAEIRYLAAIGADAVGMSTVPEVIAANYLKIDVLGISCITNMATGISIHAHTHEDVVNTAKMTAENFRILLREIIKKI